MDTMKDRSRIINAMDKVCASYFFYYFYFMFCFIGEYFCNDGDRYEGEWKDDK